MDAKVMKEMLESSNFEIQEATFVDITTTLTFSKQPKIVLGIIQGVGDLTQTSEAMFTFGAHYSTSAVYYRCPDFNSNSHNSFPIYFSGKQMIVSRNNQYTYFQKVYAIAFF